MKSFLVTVTAIALTVVTVAQPVLAGDCGSGMKARANLEQNIVQTAVAAGNFNTLAKALTVTGLDQALAGEGPFTVFAPTDQAFSKLPEGTLESLLANPEKLAEILKYHVVSGKKMATEVLAGTDLATLQGGQLSASQKDGKAFINAAAITATDIKSSNGVIHVIDSVLLPSS